MTKNLAIVKKAYQISMSNSDKETVLLANEPDRKSLLHEKSVVVLDGITLNGAYMVSEKEVSLSDD